MALINQFLASTTATAATVVLGTGPMIVHSVYNPKAAAGTMSLTDTTGNVTYYSQPTGAIGCAVLDMTCSNGLKIVQGSASDTITVTFQN